MQSWIVTGGVGCGKSHVMKTLGALTARFSACFSADAAVREIIEKPAVAAQIQAEFGVPLTGKEPAAVRDWLRENVLPVPAKRTRLESILHPPVLAALEEARRAARKGGVNLFLAEVPLHYEIGGTVSADFVIVVASSRSVQVRRMMENRGLDEPTVQKFLDAQWPIEAKVERADSVIWNDGSLASLEAQVLTLASPLLQA
ncbi:MAG TPA: dephospho-CoA kinase [Prosthecobacter sp.]